MKKIMGLIFFTVLISCSSKNSFTSIDKEIEHLNKFIDEWHYSATIANEDIYFGSMDSNAVYLGTDPNERWLKYEFKSWGMKYFERDTAWAFVPYSRYWEFSDDMNYAWFDELLDTHMGICRGSGVVKRYADGWKIKHYNLALTLANEQMSDYKKLIQSDIK
ncbi:nuclear transport factor 2 family protein [Bacteroidota bacterium]